MADNKLKQWKRYSILVGSDKETKVLDLDNIRRIVSKHFRGYSLIEQTGVWNYETERSVEIVIVKEEDNVVLAKVIDTVLDLQSELNRESIGLGIADVEYVIT